MGITLIPSEGSTVEVSKDGTTFSDIPWIGDIAGSGGEAPESDIPTLTAIGKITGAPRVSSISISVLSYVPNLPVWDTLHDAYANRTPLTFRIRTKEIEQHTASGAGNTAAIAATTGIVTFAGDKPDFTSNQYEIGLALLVGGKRYTISAISSTGVLTVSPAPAAAVTATISWKIIIPRLQLGDPFLGNVRSMGNFNIPAEGVMNTNLEITPRNLLAHWKVVN